MNGTNRFPAILLMMGLALLLLAGCAAQREAEDAAPQPDIAEAPAEAEKPDAAEAPAEERAARDADTAAHIAHAAEDKKIIQNARLSLEVSAPREAAAEIQDAADTQGGYVSDISERQLDERRVTISMTVRVPADAFRDFHARIVNLGTVTDSRVWSTDVTEEYIDLRARLDNLKSEEEGLRRLLEEADTVDEVLSVRRHLTDIRGQIESLEGRLRYLDDRISYSTVEISLRPETLPGGAISASGLDNLAPRLAQAFIRGANWLLNGVGWGLIALASALPTLVALFVLGAVIWYAVARIRRR